MHTKIVCFSPSSGRALVYEGENVWLIDARDPSSPKREIAPQMYNMHMDVLSFEEYIQDEFPYPSVQTRIKVLYSLATAVSSIFYSFDKDLDLELRQEFARAAKACTEEVPEILRFVKEAFSGEEAPPESFEVLDEVVAEMGTPLQEIIREMIKKQCC
jgi:hypothetical protein